MGTENDQNIKYLTADYYWLRRNAFGALTIMMILIIGLMAIPFFNHNSVAFVILGVCCLAWLFIMIRAWWHFAQRWLITVYDFLVLTYNDDDGTKHYRYIGNEKHLDDLNKLIGDPQGKLSQYYKLESQHIIDQKIIEGYRKQGTIKDEAWYLSKDGEFYFDDNLDALLAFSSKEVAQEYVNQKLPHFKGSIIPIRVALDGQIKPESKDDDPDAD